MNKIIVFIICTLFIVIVSGFNYQEYQYQNNACTGHFTFHIKTAKCSTHGFVRKVNDSMVMIIPIKSSHECVDSNDGSPKPTSTPTPTPTPTINNSSKNGTSSNDTSLESSGSHHNSSSTELTSSHNNSTDLSSSSSLNNNSTNNSTNSSNEPYTPPTYFKINECNLLPDGTSVFVTIEEEADELPYKEFGYCNDIELLDVNCDYPKVRTYSNFTCIPLGKNEKGVAQFERISCRANLQSIDYDYCLHDCTNVNCNYNYTKSSGVILCPDIRTTDSSSGANSIFGNSILFNNISIFLFSITIYFVLYI